MLFFTQYFYKLNHNFEFENLEILAVENNNFNIFHRKGFYKQKRCDQ